MATKMIEEIDRIKKELAELSFKILYGMTLEEWVKERIQNNGSTTKA